MSYHGEVIAERASVPVVFALFAAAVGALVSPLEVPALPGQPQFVPPACTLEAPVVADRAAESERAYRAKQFQRAADLADDPSTTELLRQLDRAWSTGMSPGSHPSLRFPALREAAKLDLALGGAFADEIYRATASVGSEAAIVQVGHRDFESARRTVDTLRLLGVPDDSNIRAVESILRREGI
jgi:hypothetical protein